MNNLEKTKVFLSEKKQFISGIIVTMILILSFILLKEPILALGRSFWVFAEVFALPLAILVASWLIATKLSSKSQGENLAPIGQQPTVLESTWRNQLLAIAGKDQMTLGELYQLRAALRYAKYEGEELTETQRFNNEMITFCERTIAKYATEIQGEVCITDANERETVRIYARYLLKIDWETVLNQEKPIELAVILVNVTEKTRTLLSDMHN